jgi:hypothetical protein
MVFGVPNPREDDRADSVGELYGGDFGHATSESGDREVDLNLSDGGDVGVFIFIEVLGSSRDIAANDVCVEAALDLCEGVEVSLKFDLFVSAEPAMKVVEFDAGEVKYAAPPVSGDSLPHLIAGEVAKHASESAPWVSVGVNVLIGCRVRHAGLDTGPPSVGQDTKVKGREAVAGAKLSGDVLVQRHSGCLRGAVASVGEHGGHSAFVVGAGQEVETVYKDKVIPMTLQGFKDRACSERERVAIE